MAACIACGGPLGRTNKSGYCKRNAACWSARQAAHAASLRGKAQRLLVNARHRAKRAGLPCDLTIEWAERELAFAVENGCPLLGIAIRVQAVGVAGPDSPSIDRLDPHLGYAKANCWIISHRANAMKGDVTPDFLRRILEAAETRFAVGAAVWLRAWAGRRACT